MGLATRLLVATTACGLLTASSARNLSDFSVEVRRSNVLRVSRQSCEECVTLEELFGLQKITFVLFYERALVGHQRFKTAIVKGFHETCADLRFSHVLCGAVDMVDDKEYAEKYIDPKTAPGHILFRQGEPVVIAKRHMDRLFERPGDKEAVLWHLGDLLASDASPLSLQISAEVKDAGTLGRLLQRHESTVVVAGAASANSVRSAAQRLVLQGVVPDALKVKAGKAKKREPGSKPLFFVVASGAKTLKAYNLTAGEIGAFVGKRRLPSGWGGGGLRSEELAAEAMMPIVSSLLKETIGSGAADQATSAPNQQQPRQQPKSGASSGKGKRRARRRARAAAEL